MRIVGTIRSCDVTGYAASGGCHPVDVTLLMSLCGCKPVDVTLLMTPCWCQSVGFTLLMSLCCYHSVDLTLLTLLCLLCYCHFVDFILYVTYNGKQCLSHLKTVMVARFSTLQWLLIFTYFGIMRESDCNWFYTWIKRCNEFFFLKI